MKLYRHGDLALVEIKKLPKGLVKSKTNILLAGNSGHNHSFDNGTFYEKVEGDYIKGYFVAKNTTLRHEDHGDTKNGSVLEAKIEDGIYEVRGQVEKSHDGLKPVID